MHETEQIWQIKGQRNENPRGEFLKISVAILIFSQSTSGWYWWIGEFNRFTRFIYSRGVLFYKKM